MHDSRQAEFHQGGILHGSGRKSEHREGDAKLDCIAAILPDGHRLDALCCGELLFVEDVGACRPDTCRLVGKVAEGDHEGVDVRIGLHAEVACTPSQTEAITQSEHIHPDLESIGRAVDAIDPHRNDLVIAHEEVQIEEFRIVCRADFEHQIGLPLPVVAATGDIP